MVGRALLLPSFDPTVVRPLTPSMTRGATTSMEDAGSMSGKGSRGGGWVIARVYPCVPPRKEDTRRKIALELVLPGARF
jgi:hypothetical protein